MNPKELANKHWEWVEGLHSHMEYLYKTAFEHGFKHGVQSVGMSTENEQTVYKIVRCPECTNPIGMSEWCATCKKFNEPEGSE